jgi:cysteine desulfurase
MTGPVYLDYNATTPVDPVVAAAMTVALTELFGNPSSAHVFGQRSRDAVAHARAQVAALIGAVPDEIVFTGSATEANNLALRGVTSALAVRGRHVITSAIDHPSVAEPCRLLAEQGFSITVVPVDTWGCIDPGAIAAAVRPDTVLISVMHANNEVGTLEPIADIARIAHEHGIVFHADAAQSVGKVPVRVEDLGVDLLTLAGHKFYAPKGIGALYVRTGTPLNPILYGGGQERGLRSGTENVVAIVGLGEAARLVRTRWPAASARLEQLRKRLHDGLNDRVPGLVLNGHPTARLPNTLNVSFPAVDAQELLLRSADHVAASTGAACHVGRPASGVLAAMGLDDERIRGAVRFSVGWPTTEAGVDSAVERLGQVWERQVAGR